MAGSGPDRPDVDSIDNRTTTGACGKAKKNLAKAKRRLAKLKWIDAPSKAIRGAKRKLRSARRAAEWACADKDALFDVTALSARFDATSTRDPESSCTFTKDAHWTATLAPGAGPARLQVYYRDKQGRPVYRFYGSDGGIPWKAQGSGVATRTCDQPPPGSSGTVSCNFQAQREGSVVVESDPEGSRDQMTLDWFFGFSSFRYEDPSSGGACAYSGPFPPTLLSGENSPGLFVSPLNEGGGNALEPPGFSTIPTASLAGGTTLNFAGSTSASFGGSLEASWQLSVTLRPR
ncbi:MAG TPA: hypothetical protein VIT85_01835 [Solirubrobacterales bacterium]